LPREPFNLAELIVRQGSVDAVFVRRTGSCSHQLPPRLITPLIVL